MQRKLLGGVLLCVTILATMAAHHLRAPAGAPVSAAAAAAYGTLPLNFEPNVGQGAAGVNFLAHGSGYTLALSAGTAAFDLRRGSTKTPTTAAPSAADTAELQLQLVGADPQGGGEGEAPLPGTVNYFIGNDPRAWRTNIPTYARVRYRNVYPGVDLVYHGRQGQVEYDFEVAPGANPAQVRLVFAGSTGLAVDGQGGLLVHLPDGVVRQERPALYQEVRGERRAVVGGYRMRRDGQVGFTVGRYDSTQPLVIDPVLLYATYLGGSGSGSIGDEGRGIAVDAAGNAYVTGFTSSANFPTNKAVQPAYGGGDATAFVAKLNPTGSALLYSTYLGGSGGDRGTGIAVDGAGAAYVTGTTGSPNFPTTPGAFQTAPGDLQRASGDQLNRAFVAKLNPAGSALVYATYLGGSDFDGGRSIAVDGAGNAYVTGQTGSPDFPTQNPLHATLIGPGTDAFVTKLNPAGTSLVYSTFLGASAAAGTGIAIDSAGNAYLTGFTDRADLFPTQNPLQVALTGTGTDAFVAELNPAGSSLVYSTILGRIGFNSGVAIAVDGAGNAYVTGSAFALGPGSSGVPSTAGAFAQSGGAFVAKLNPTGGALVYSTYLGGSDFQNDRANGIAVDEAGDAYVTGDTDAPDFRTQNPLQSTLGSENGNAFVVELNPAGSALVYATYLGGSTGDLGDAGYGIAVDGEGNAYVTGRTSSHDFPTKNPFQATYSGGQSNAFVAKLGGGGAIGGASGPQPGTALPAAAPAAPGNLTATVQDATSVLLTWTFDPAAAGTVIDDATGHAIATTGSGQTSDTVQGLTPGSYVCFIASAFNAAGSSGWSDWACATVQLPAGVSFIEIATDDQFSLTSMQASSGQPITLTVVNQGQALHLWHLLGQQNADGTDIKTPPLLPGAAATITFTINEPGSYTFRDEFHPTEQYGTLVITGPQ